MDRRQALRWISTSALAGGTSLLPPDNSLLPLRAQSKPDGGPRFTPRQDPGYRNDPDLSQWRPPRHSESIDHRAWPARIRMCNLHPEAPRSANGGGEVSQTLPVGKKRR